MWGRKPPPCRASRYPGPGRSPPRPPPPGVNDWTRRERWSVISKPTTRPAARRGSPPSTDRAEGKLQEIVSVRFSDEELRRIQAFAVIFETTPNAVIREACSFFLSHKVGSADYQQALEAYHRRTSEVVDVLEHLRSPAEPTAAAEGARSSDAVTLRGAAR
jgi:hypothetical protein